MSPRPPCLVCQRTQGKDLPGFCRKCWTDRLTEGEKLAILSPYHRAGIRAYHYGRPDEDILLIGKNDAPPPEVPGQPAPLWSTGWTVYSYGPEGRPEPLDHILTRMEIRMVEAAVVKEVKRRWAEGCWNPRQDSVMYGQPRARGDHDDQPDDTHPASG